MSSTDEVAPVVRGVLSIELAELRRWVYEFDSRVWDAKLEADVVTGKMDARAKRAFAEYRADRTRLL